MGKIRQDKYHTIIASKSWFNSNNIVSAPENNKIKNQNYKFLKSVSNFQRKCPLNDHQVTSTCLYLLGAC